MTQTSLFDPPVAQVRSRDPKPSKRAAASDVVGRASQIKTLLGRLRHGPISADTAGQVIGKHRSIASTRLAVMEKRGLVVKAGEHPEPDQYGRVRKVCRYRLTEAGWREHALMFGGVE